MRKDKWIPTVFFVAAAYDGILGLLFLFIPRAIFDLWGVRPPYHMGYIQFPAALLIVFAWLFITIAREPIGNRNLIPFGIGLKVSYCVVVFWYWLFSDISLMWKPFAVFDAIFGVLFYLAYKRVGQEVPNEVESSENV